MSLTTHPNAPKNIEIECLRGLAVIFVLIQHLPGLFLWTSNSANRYAVGMWVGVDLFFAISGYVIARGLVDQLQDVEGELFWRRTIAFWIRRAWRILPTAWLWLAVPAIYLTLAASLRGQSVSASLYAGAAAAVLQVSNFHHYACSIKESAYCGAFPIYWSLSLEEQFYIVFPFVVLLARRHILWVVAFFAVIQVPFSRDHWQGLAAFVRTDAICLGVCVALLARSPYYRIFEPIFLRGRAQLFSTTIIVAAIATVVRLQLVPFALGLTSLICAVAVWIASYDRGYMFRSKFCRVVLGWCGSRSFAIYLCQIPVFILVQDAWRYYSPTGGFDGTYFLRFFLPAIALIALFSELNYRFVETPLRRKGREVAERFAEAGSDSSQNMKSLPRKG
jgi:peptidoglycan/LPS O-acetylase OafA/YrhL